jgi:hypothetical protein
MRVVLISILMLSACSTEEPQPCLDAFCLPAGAELVGHQQPADFDLYQVEWHDARFGIYTGDFPMFEVGSGEKRELASNANAEIKTDGSQGEILMQLGEQSPRYLHLTGPCEAVERCALVAFADAIKTAERE